MDIENWAKKLSGRFRGEEISPQEEVELAKDGLIYIYGYSDDCVEICGAYDDEFGAYEKKTIGSDGRTFIDKRDGSVISGSEIDISYEDSWIFKTSLPHKEVIVYWEEGDIFSTGLLIKKKDIDKCAALNTIKAVQNALTIVEDYLEENNE